MHRLIQTKNLTKKYPGITALDSVDFDLFAGEVHILFGENGAGKSTLISMLAGANTPSSGSLKLNGEEISFQSVKDAQNHGVYTVFQEFSLIPTMSVEENMFLGAEPKKGGFIDRRAMRRLAKAQLEQLDFPIEPKAVVSSLPRAQQQMIEIAKALIGKAKLLILDEPTASLTEREVIQLFAFIRKLKSEGVGIIYTSHRTQEFHEIGDRITVLRDGKKIATKNIADTTEQELVNLMTGREISEIYPKIERQKGDTVLSVENIRTIGVREANFDVRKGEVLGVAGLVGSGKSRLWRMIVGLKAVHGGNIYYQGEEITHFSTKKILEKGIHYLSPDRKDEGLDLGKESHDNLAINLVMNKLSSPLSLINWLGISKQSNHISDRVELYEGYRKKMVSQLSGGNQQKVLFGKCFAHDCELYIFDEPTVGVDMGTRAAIYQLIKSLSESGKAVVVISSDLPEAMSLSHRLMVMAHGHIATILEQEHITEERVLRHFFEE